MFLVTAWAVFINTMKYETGFKQIYACSNAFKASNQKVYGQVSLRFNDDIYLSTGANKFLTDIIDSDIQEYDINTGSIGALFGKLSDANVILFACTPDSIAASSEVDFLDSAIDDLAMISGRGIKVVPDASLSHILSPLKECSVCLIKGRGILVATDNMKKAVAGFLIAEKSCQAYVYGKLIGGIKPFDNGTADDIRRKFTSSYVEKNQKDHVEYIGFDEDSFELRKLLTDCGRRMVADQLSCGSWGNISVRLDDENMLISPSAMDYHDIKIEDIVKVDINTMEYGNQREPSGESSLHARMYRELPGCNAIIHTHSNALSVFAACEAGFALADPSLKQLIGDVKFVPYAQAGTESLEKLIIETMQNTHATILAHHGAIFYGPNMEITYQIASAVEQMARNLLKSGAENKDEE